MCVRLFGDLHDILKNPALKQKPSSEAEWGNHHIHSHGSASDNIQHEDWEICQKRGDKLWK